MRRLASLFSALDTGLQRQKIRQQTAVEEIDCQGATGDVRAAHMLISSRHSPDVATGAMGGHDEFAYGRGVAQTEIEALRPDRGDYVRRFPDQNHASGSQTRRGLDPQLKETATGLDGAKQDFG